jgi:hypothetical protein
MSLAAPVTLHLADALDARSEIRRMRPAHLPPFPPPPPLLNLCLHCYTSISTPPPLPNRPVHLRHELLVLVVHGRVGWRRRRRRPRWLRRRRRRARRLRRGPARGRRRCCCVAAAAVVVAAVGRGGRRGHRRRVCGVRRRRAPGGRRAAVVAAGRRRCCCCWGRVVACAGGRRRAVGRRRHPVRCPVGRRRRAVRWRRPAVGRVGRRRSWRRRACVGARVWWVWWVWRGAGAGVRCCSAQGRDVVQAPLAAGRGCSRPAAARSAPRWRGAARHGTAWHAGRAAAHRSRAAGSGPGAERRRGKARLQGRTGEGQAPGSAPCRLPTGQRPARPQQHACGPAREGGQAGQPRQQPAHHTAAAGLLRPGTCAGRRRPGTCASRRRARAAGLRPAPSCRCPRCARPCSCPPACTCEPGGGGEGGGGRGPSQQRGAACHLARPGKRAAVRSREHPPSVQPCAAQRRAQRAGQPPARGSTPGHPPVEAADGGLRRAHAAHAHERKALGQAGGLVQDEPHVLHRAVAPKQGLQLRLGRRGGQEADLRGRREGEG